MSKILSALPLAALLMLGTALQAQEDNAPDAAQEAQEAVEDTAPDAADAASEAADTASEAEGENAADAEPDSDTPPEADPGAGTEAQNPAQGAVTDQLSMGRENEDPTYTKAEYGSWQLKCFKSEAETQEELCQMYQLLTEEAGNPVAEFSLFRLPEGERAAAGATLVVPLGTLLESGIQISIDGAKAKAYSYAFCSMVGCFARVGFTQAEIDAFKKGKAATLTIVPAQAPDQSVEIKAPLDGFTAAYDNVSVIEN